ncbi:MAG: GHKL domain-containing protein [Bacteroidetes bacterium]|nr:GHKL domain-containing protein [Bacteroidota bacterium]
MVDLTKYNLVTEFIHNILIFDKNNKIVFAGDEINKVLLNSEISVDEIFSKDFPEQSEQYRLKNSINKARESQKAIAFKFNKIQDEFIIFPTNTNKNVILSMKDEVIQISNIEHDLKERVKELESLYNTSRDIETSKNLEETFERITCHMEEGFQFPEFVNVNLIIDGKSYGKKDNRKIYNKLNADIILNRKIRGEIIVNLHIEGGFLKEEKKLIDEISGKISRAIEKNEKKKDIENQKKKLLLKNKELVKVTEKCYESTEKLKTFFSAITDRIVVIDKNYNIIMSNKEDIGNSGKCHRKLFNSESRCDNCPASLTFKSGKNNIFERKWFNQYFLLRSYPIHNKKGETDRVLEVCRDVTMNKKIESQLQQSYKLASLGKLVAGIAHEINNPNTFILGNLKIISEAFNDILPILDNYYAENKDKKIARLDYDVFKENFSVLLNDMIDGANRTKKIVMDLRNFAKKDEETLLESVDINHLIKEHLTFTQKYIKSNANIELKLSPNIPKFNGNIRKLEQVLMNIIINASEAIKDENGLINVETRHDKSKNEIIIKITDNGEGMDEETRKNIFDPFFTTKRNEGGTGLGLSISYGIIKEHNGAINVESKLGSGTTFTIHIPVIQQKK